MIRSTLALLALTLAAHAQPVNIPSIPLISVMGKAEIFVPPDQIVFRLHLSSEDPQPASAMAANQRQLEALRDLLKGVAVSPGSFQVTDVQLARPYQNGTRKSSYEASRDCVFTLSEVAQKDQLLLTLAQAQVGEVRSAQAALANPVPWRQKARLQALQQAEQKAKSMADSLHQGMGKAYWVEEINPESWLGPQTNMATMMPSEDNQSGLGRIRIQATVKAAFLLQ